MEKWDIYRYIIKTDVTEICDKIVRNLDGLQTNILHWFGSGDCETKLISKIALIIDHIPVNVIQMGFTKNPKLWRRYPHIFALSVEKIEDIKSKTGLFSISNYKEGVSVMYSPTHKIKGGVCGDTCRDATDTTLEHHVNCKLCCKLKLGCFDRNKNDS